MIVRHRASLEFLRFNPTIFRGKKKLSWILFHLRSLKLCLLSKLLVVKFDNGFEFNSSHRNKIVDKAKKKENASLRSKFQQRHKLLIELLKLFVEQKLSNPIQLEVRVKKMNLSNFFLQITCFKLYIVIINCLILHPALTTILIYINLYTKVLTCAVNLKKMRELMARRRTIYIDNKICEQKSPNRSRGIAASANTTWHVVHPLFSRCHHRNWQHFSDCAFAERDSSEKCRPSLGLTAGSRDCHNGTQT